MYHNYLAMMMVYSLLVHDESVHTILPSGEGLAMLSSLLGLDRVVNVLGSLDASSENSYGSGSGGDGLAMRVGRECEAKLDEGAIKSSDKHSSRGSNRLFFNGRSILSQRNKIQSSRTFLL